jgi:hypothetical protein
VQLATRDEVPLRLILGVNAEKKRSLRQQLRQLGQTRQGPQNPGV